MAEQGKYAAFVIPVEGDTYTTTAEHASVEQMQALVGGYVEAVRIGGLFLLLDEDGLSRRLPVNGRATRLVEMIGGTLMQPLVGQVAFVGADNPENPEQFADVPPALIDSYNSIVNIETSQR
jgi:hypothetical protein